MVFAGEPLTWLPFFPMKFKLLKSWLGIPVGEEIDVDLPVAELLAERGIVSLAEPQSRRIPAGADQMPQPSAIKHVTEKFFGKR